MNASQVVDRARDLATPRNMTTAVAALIVLLALIYLVAGGGQFSRAEVGMLDTAAAAARDLDSVKVSAEFIIESEKRGKISGNAMIQAGRDGDYTAVYSFSDSGAVPSREAVVFGGQAYLLDEGGGSWYAHEGGEYSFRPDYVFEGASGILLGEKEAIGGVECDRLSYGGGGALIEALVPGAQVTGISRVSTVVWVESGEHLLKHARIDASGLESATLGDFSCHIEAAFSDHDAPLEIRPPI